MILRNIVRVYSITHERLFVKRAQENFCKRGKLGFIGGFHIRILAAEKHLIGLFQNAAGDMIFLLTGASPPVAPLGFNPRLSAPHNAPMK